MMGVEEAVIGLPTPAVFEPLLGEARYKGAHGGRGSGKSHFFAGLIVEESISTQIRAVCAREVQKSLDQSVKQLIEDQIANVQSLMDVHGLAHLARFKIRDSWIEGPNDSYYTFVGMADQTARSVKSMERYNRAWLEEAQDIKQRSLDLIRPTIREEGSQIYASWNPKDPDDPIEKLLRGPKRIANSIVVEANYLDNPWFPNVLREEMEYDLRHNPEKHEHVWLGKFWLQSDRRVFNNWRIDAFETPLNVPVWRYGADWGYAVDPTVLVRSFTAGSTLFIDYEAYKVGCKIDLVPELFDTIQRGHARKHPIVADSARPDMIDYMKRHGYPLIKPAEKGQGSVEDGIEFLKNFNIVVHPRCKHTIDELKTYSWKVDPKTEKVLPILVDKHNHVIDSLRYAAEGMRLGTYTLANVR